MALRRGGGCYGGCGRALRLRLVGTSRSGRLLGRNRLCGLGHVARAPRRHAERQHADQQPDGRARRWPRLGHPCRSFAPDHRGWGSRALMTMRTSCRSAATPTSTGSASGARDPAAALTSAGCTAGARGFAAALTSAGSTTGARGPAAGAQTAARSTTGARGSAVALTCARGGSRREGGGARGAEAGAIVTTRGKKARSSP